MARKITKIFAYVSFKRYFKKTDHTDYIVALQYRQKLIVDHACVFESLL